VLIEQAKGILAERLGIAMEEAFSALRGHARAHHSHLTELAHAVVAGTEDVTAVHARAYGARPPPDAHG